MARPQKEGLEYFSHDTDASNDEKIEGLEALYVNDGYAFYFKLCERIYRAPGAELVVSDAETIQILANKIHINVERFNTILKTALKIGLFDVDAYEKKGVLTSHGIKARAGVVFEKRRLMVERYEKTKLNKVSDAETIQKSSRNTPETTQSKVKESKVKESKVNTYPPISAEMKLATRLQDGMVKNDPAAKIPKDLQIWADEINKIIRLDGRSETEVQRAIDYSQSCEFWKPNILSATKLREKIATLLLQADRDAKENFREKKGDYGANQRYSEPPGGRQLSNEELQRANDAFHG